MKAHLLVPHTSNLVGLSLDMLQQDISQVQQDFYDGLYLQSLLQSDAKRRVKSGERDLPRIITAYRRNDWQKFLDDMCLLCDSSPGGATTAAIAVEQSPQGTIFWVASDFDNNKRLQPYLTGLLRMIQLGGRHVDHYTTRVSHEAVLRSPGRVENYVGRLVSALKSLEISHLAEPEGGRNIRALLKNLVNLRHDHVKLCTEAHRLRQDAILRAFLRERRSKYDCWFQVHHYLARLGSWHRAARSVLELGRRFPDVLAAPKVCCVPVLSDPSRTAPELDADPGVVLERVCPNYKGTIILANAKSRVSSAKKLADRYQRVPQIPVPHAETQTLHYFFTHELVFVGGDRYVGCSKPSCYSCAKYFHFHPMRARTGRMHNNVWLKWGLPSALLETDGEVHRHSLRMMRVMADSIRHDIIGLIMGNDMQAGAMFDSTTGLTASVQALSSYIFLDP